MPRHPAAAQTPSQPNAPSNLEADRLYADRENLDSARRAAALWEADLRSAPAGFDAAWKLARAGYWLGGHVPEAERRPVLERGIEAGRTAVSLRTSRPEGHFWIAANMGALADASGVRAGLKYRGTIRDELETVLRLDPAFMDGSADRVLGRWYFRVPRLFGGDRTLAEVHLRKSLTYNPNSTTSHFFLGELLQDEGRNEEARAEFQRVLDASPHPDWAPEDREFKDKARRALSRLK